MADQVQTIMDTEEQSAAGKKAPDFVHLHVHTMFSLLDGSVRFISDTVDVGDLSVAPVRRGASPYGVWGALGTPNGGESASL